MHVYIKMQVTLVIRAGLQSPFTLYVQAGKQNFNTNVEFELWARVDGDLRDLVLSAYTV